MIGSFGMDSGRLSERLDSSASCSGLSFRLLFYLFAMFLFRCLTTIVCKYVHDGLLTDSANSLELKRRTSPTDTQTVNEDVNIHMWMLGDRANAVHMTTHMRARV